MKWIYEIDPITGKAPHAICSNCKHECFYNSQWGEYEDILTPYCPWCGEKEKENANT